MSAPLPDIRTAPAQVQAEAAALRAALDAQIPPKRDIDRNLLLATWNICQFASLSDGWEETGGSPVRNWRGLHAIAEIVSRFDVIAVQEIKGDLRALRTLMKTLGPEWGFLATDVNRGDRGNDERMGFLFDHARARLSGLAGELTIPLEGLEDSPLRAFARAPYAVSFQAGAQTFILAVCHVFYGDDGPVALEERRREIDAFARWMADWAETTNRWHQDLLVLGDFNIDRMGDPLYEAFVSRGLRAPEALHAVPRTIFQKPSFYDQVAWFESGDGARGLTMELLSAGGFDFRPHVYADPPMPSRSLAARISDHFPLWVEFRAAG
ncbi:endonuclease/exonuclease/phosphatase family protein [Albimonas sp. CAU 1670]|uniref:endonuclease/exonuclease/phosphatase family protein n=1 Tax=Albimonas sp. CAU 1670 TaxID=3032599 RepID=UPI0023DB60D8|nr:endonuclease/exonuclease/phosphatase family protein [Albimonas sp. CAU 1670]MDF2235407.1 endonuclease/exonuclease/phosphatase family protein [Albimonas sp. CAU 1670]